MTGTASRRRQRALALAVLLAAALACRPAEPAGPRRPQRPVVLIGIDGAEWSVIRELWERGELPALRALATRGVSATLRTDYALSPVIWTTIATGRRPREHGITDFVVPASSGDVPVSSTVRQVPALWNMASTAGLRVAVVSWWASWPAEEVNGVVVSDRALLGVPRGVSPLAFAGRFAELRRRAAARPNRFGGNPAAAERDQVTAETAAALAAGGEQDLLLAYFRGVDVASHLYWRYYRPAGFPPLDPALAAAHADEVPRVYAATDEAIGRLLAAAPEANVIVVSDHGFLRLREEQVIVTLPFDRLLARLGYLGFRGDGIDWGRTRLYTWASPPNAKLKRLRFALAGREPGGTVLPGEREALRAELARDLARLTWADGRPAFHLRDPRPREARDGADLVVAVLPAGDDDLRLDGRSLPGLVEEVTRISGSHGKNAHGVFLAAGPDVLPGASAEGIHIHDVAPTVLFALGLPVGEDLAGRAWSELFTRELRRHQPLRTIPTWGAPRAGRATTSQADAELVRELRALGYLGGS